MSTSTEDVKPTVVKTDGAKDSKDSKDNAEWDVDFSSNVAKWSELTAGEKVQAVLVILAKLAVHHAARLNAANLGCALAQEQRISDY